MLITFRSLLVTRRRCALVTLMCVLVTRRRMLVTTFVWLLFVARLAFGLRSCERLSVAVASVARVWLDGRRVRRSWAAPPYAAPRAWGHSASLNAQRDD